MKTCTRCGIAKLESKFYKNKRRKDGYNSWCKSCQNLYHVNWYSENGYRMKRKKYVKTPEQNRRSNIKQYFGISMEEYDARRESQGDICALCDKETADLVLDHDHITGKLRSFICRSCNTKLGWFEKRQKKIIAYIN